MRERGLARWRRPPGGGLRINRSPHGQRNGGHQALDRAEAIVAIVTLTPDKVKPGGAPIFVAGTVEERERVAMYISRIMDVMVHDLENGTYILVRH